MTVAQAKGHSKGVLTSIEIIKMLNNKEDKEFKQIDLASEVKVATMCFQNQLKRISPVAILLAQPHSANKISRFSYGGRGNEHE